MKAYLDTLSSNLLGSCRLMPTIKRKLIVFRPKLLKIEKKIFVGPTFIFHNFFLLDKPILEEKTNSFHIFSKTWGVYTCRL